MGVNGRRRLFYFIGAIFARVYIVFIGQTITKP